MNKLADLENIIKIKFKNKQILKQSLVHKSYDKNNNNEKFEFLGDRILGFIISKELLKIYPMDTEGSLDKINRHVSKLEIILILKILCF